MSYCFKGHRNQHGQTQCQNCTSSNRFQRQSTRSSVIRNPLFNRKEFVQILKSVQNKILQIGNVNIEVLERQNHLKRSFRNLTAERERVARDLQNLNESSRIVLQRQSATDEKLKLIQEKLNDFHYATYNGRLMWKIDEFDRKLNNLKCGEEVCLFSPKFHTSASGYALKACLTLHADEGRNYLSVGITLCRGNYDPILQWPFPYPIYFCLRDQTGRERHVIKTLKCDINSPCYARPSDNVNPSMFIRQFCPLTDLENDGCDYTKDNVMFIDVRVDFEKTPLHLMQYSFSLNPGLPIDEQEARKFQEHQKFKEAREALAKEVEWGKQKIAGQAFVPNHPLLAGDKPAEFCHIEDPNKVSNPKEDCDDE